MPRYIDADKADVERISCFYGAECTLEDVQEWLDEQPTANVVPRAEYEQLQRKYELAVAEREANVKGFSEVIAKAKSEVAREIFDEIESVLFTVARPCPNAGGTIIVKHSNDFHLRIEDYYTIKEKYTKGGEADA